MVKVSKESLYYKTKESSDIKKKSFSSTQDVFSDKELQNCHN